MTQGLALLGAKQSLLLSLRAWTL